MAEERTLGLARAPEYSSEEPSKEELQRRLDDTRDSISQTVMEIKETVANQVQAVKDTLDWREQFRRRPLAWSAGALGVGFLTGYCLAATFKDDDDYRRYTAAIDRYEEETKSYAAQPVLGAHANYAAGMSAPQVQSRSGNGSHEGPGFFERISHTPAYERVRHEAGNIGNAIVQELSNTAKTVVVPALITSLRNFIGGHLPNAPQSNQPKSTYQPARDV
ncbi:MAG TPA: hypothetical protein VHH35_21740, partial [Pyrinomonadaceae bacterium]|nr:hypothetical protein [Pyrinomonadaceae bacterium]